MTRDATPSPPPLSELLARYLQRQASAHAAGLAVPEPGEVFPFEAAPAQPIDPRLAWDEALDAARHLGPAFDARSLRPPADWSGLVSAHEPVAALAFCLGNFPQIVRDLQPLTQTSDLTALRQGPSRPLPAPALAEWASDAAQRRRFPQGLLAVGALRLARHFDAAADLLKRLQKDAPKEWRPVLANEEAALAWHAGRAEDALALWQGQAESVPVLFNRGMAALFLGRPADARPALQQAAARLPEENAWHHLARLYLALAEMRG